MERLERSIDFHDLDPEILRRYKGYISQSLNVASTVADALPEDKCREATNLVQTKVDRIANRTLFTAPVNNFQLALRKYLQNQFP